MGKHAADLDLKTPEGRSTFENLLAEVDVLVDGYRPGALERLGYGVDTMKDLAMKRGKGIVYVNENCFGYVGEWSGRPGWQQIADCVSCVRSPPVQHTDVWAYTGQRCSMGSGEVHGLR